MTTISIRDVSLFVKVIGQGYPLLLMHGGPGLDHSIMSPFLSCADQFTLIFYDHRCNGRSTGADVSTMTWENLTADAEALRQMLGYEQWAVLGHSFGGMVALEYALRYPQSLSHLLLLDTCGESRWAQENAPETLAKRGYDAKTVEAARRFFNGQITPGEFFPTVLKFSSAYYYHLSPFKVVHEMISGFRIKSRRDTLIYFFSQVLPGWSVMDRLGEIEVPTLVLAGEDDFQFPPEHQEKLAAGIANARLALIERAGHNAPMERTAEVMQTIRDFMAQTSSAALDMPGSQAGSAVQARERAA